MIFCPEYCIFSVWKVSYRCIQIKNGVIIINIEIQEPNRLKEFFQNLHSKAEDILFSIIQKLPEKLIPPSLMNWLDRYTTKRISQLQQQIIKQRWRQDALEKAVSDIRSINQDTKKAPSED